MTKNSGYVKKHQTEKEDTITIRPPKGTKDRWRAAADLDGKSLQRFIIDIVNQHIEAQENESVTHR